MNISAINCTPIKPKVSFGDVEHSKFDAEKLHSMASDLDSKSVDSKDIKKPLAVIASLAALVGIAYGGGKKVATGVNIIYEKVAAAAKPVIKEGADDVVKAAKEGADDVADAVKNSNLGLVLENGLKKVSTIASNGISKIKSSNVGDAVTKKDIIRNKTADILEKGLNIAKNGYKKIAYSGVPANADAAAKAQAAFENIAGLVGVATVVPEIIKRDADDDGVKDIMQKSQNAYTSTQDKVKSASDDIGAITDIIQMFT